jgi:hypothetical protein
MMFKFMLLMGVVKSQSGGSISMRERITITKEMLEATLKEIKLNAMSDRVIAEKCLGDPSHTKTVSDVRRSHGFRKDSKTGKLLRSDQRGKRTWESSSMPQAN